MRIKQASEDAVSGYYVVGLTSWVPLVEKITAALDRTSVKPIISSTTVPPTTTSKSSTKSDSKISKNTIATEVTTTLTTSSTASASTTGTTDDDEPSVAFKQIPEAEEDDSDGGLHFFVVYLSEHNLHPFKVISGNKVNIYLFICYANRNRER